METFAERIRKEVRGALDDHPLVEIEGPTFMPLRRIHWECGWIERLSRTLSGLESKWEIRPAIPDLASSLPKAPGLYMFVWQPRLEFGMANERHSGKISQILYVGRASNLSTRFKGEYRDYLSKISPRQLFRGRPSNREQMFTRYLAVDRLEFWFCELNASEEGSLASLESRLIKFFNPPINTLDKLPRVTIHKSEPAF